MNKKASLTRRQVTLSDFQARFTPKPPQVLIAVQSLLEKAAPLLNTNPLQSNK